MNARVEKPAMSRTRFYSTVFMVVLAVWGLQVLVYQKVYDQPGTIFSQTSSTPADPSDWQKMSVQAMTDTNRLLTTLATALLGAVGLLLGNNAAQRSARRHMWAALLSAFGGVLSLYFGYVSHLNLLAMISNRTFSAYDPVYQFSSHAQFYSLLAGVIFLADFAIHDLGGKQPA
jgi:hypothetical protein